MTLSFLTRGVLNVIEAREVINYFSSIETTIEDPIEISVILEEIDEITSEVYMDSILSTIEVIDTVTEEVEDVIVVSGDITLVSGEIVVYDDRYLRRTQEVECLSGNQIGDWVYISGEPVGDRWTVDKADIYDRDKMPTMGVLIEKTDTTQGIIQIIGPCDIFTGLDITESTAWLGSTGIQYTVPNPGPGGYAVVQRIGKAIAEDVFWISGSLELYEISS